MRRQLAHFFYDFILLIPPCFSLDQGDQTSRLDKYFVFSQKFLCFETPSDSAFQIFRYLQFFRCPRKWQRFHTSKQQLLHSTRDASCRVNSDNLRLDSEDHGNSRNTNHSCSSGEGASPAKPSLSSAFMACHQYGSVLLTTWMISPHVKDKPACWHGIRSSPRGS